MQSDYDVYAVWSTPVNQDSGSSSSGQQQRLGTPRRTKRKVSTATKEVDKLAKTDGSRNLKQQQRNEDAPRCQKCVNSGQYDLEKLHSQVLALYLYDHLAGATGVTWPTSVERTTKLDVSLNRIINETDLGPTPISHRSLVSNLCHYMSVLFNSLHTYENHNITTSNVWLLQ
ncbi:hypothetical protein BCR42DRAFT_440095 [Absidia repens]|uniref:Uncharacterized protein n=1 Tax=Absidia repens TaxID=90262 RepID=A0A1X2I9M2_9FUNG|nr:hypothetical protein BCR42DRAFT_440095 [Absidia repens]